jgi:hypothetical protein
MADQQGTGKHPRKSTEEPYPHHKGGKEENAGGSHESGRGKEESGRAQSAAAGAGGSRGSERGRGGEESSSSDLKEREYRDAQGNVHHHTHTYEEQHGKEK